VSSYKGWIKQKNIIPEQHDISPSNLTHTRGGQTTFDVDKRTDKAGKFELIWTCSALSGSTGGCFSDWETPMSVERVEFLYGNKLVHKIYGEKLFSEHAKMKERELTDLAKKEFGFLSANQRIDRVVSSVQLQLDLQVPWQNINHNIPWVNLPNKLTVRITWQTLIKCTEATSGASSVVGGIISNPILCIQFTHLMQADRNNLYKMCMNPKGVVTKTTSIEYHRRETIPSGINGDFRIKLKNIKNDCY
jgi:hypothetical protein